MIGRDPERAAQRLNPAWQLLSRWAVPIMMTLAYAFLALISETDATGWAWMGAGLVLVFITWFLFRGLTERAALSRAIGVGDTVRLFELADRHLARKQRRAADRARYLVARAFAYELRGEFTKALETLDEARPAGDDELLARSIRIGALVELHRPVDEARAIAFAAPRAPSLARLSEARIAWLAGDLAGADQLLAGVIDDVRAGSAIRAIAHVYAARIADAQQMPKQAVRHRSEVARLTPPDATWLHHQNEPLTAKPT